MVWRIRLREAENSDSSISLRRESLYPTELSGPEWLMVEAVRFSFSALGGLEIFEVD